MAIILITPHPFSPIRKAQGKLPLTKTSFRVSGFLPSFFRRTIWAHFNVATYF